MVIETNCNRILILSALGFVLTGILAYPFGVNWDAAWTFGNIYKGEPVINNWLGWYFPLLWELLYKISGIPHILGCYINLLYWVSITILYLSIFDNRKLWVYFIFAWFPGTLFFVTSISNNSLFFVNLLLGFSLFVKYLVSKKSYIYWLSVILTVQSVFIRREALLIVVPLIFIYFYISSKRSFKKPVSILFSVLASFAVLFLFVGTDKLLNKKIANYDYTNTLSVIALHDMSAVTYATGELKIPYSFFSEPDVDGNDCLKEILSLSEDDLFFGDGVLHHIANYTKEDDIYRLRLPVEDVAKFYKSNFTTWIAFRAKYTTVYLNKFFALTEHGSDPSFGYQPPEPPVLLSILSYFFCLIFSPLKFFFFFSILILALDYKNRIQYKETNDRVLILFFVFSSFIALGVYMITTLNQQIRYLYPICLIQYLCFIYVVCNAKYSIALKNR